MAKYKEIGKKNSNWKTPEDVGHMGNARNTSSIEEGVIWTIWRKVMGIPRQIGLCALNSCWYSCE